MALAAYAFAIKRAPQDVLIRMHLVEEYKIMGKEREALREVNECIVIDSSDPFLFHERGVLCFRLERFEDAKASFIKVIQLLESVSPVCSYPIL